MSDTGLVIYDNTCNEAEQLKDILALRMQGKSCQIIADKYGKHRSSIHRKLKGIFRLIDKEEIDAFEGFKDPILSGAVKLVMETMLHPDKLKEASFNNLAYGFDKLNTHLRLERGQSTENIDVHAITREIGDLDKELAEIEAKLKK